MRRIAILLCLAAPGFAATIRFTGLPDNVSFGTYNGFAYATVDGTPNQLLVCDDYDHTTYVPSGDMQYTVSTLGGWNPLQYARFLNPREWEESMARYEAAAFLVDGLSHTGPNSLVNLTAQYQYALWNLFTPSVSSPDQTSQTLLEDARHAVAQPDAQMIDLYSRLRIYTPTSGFATNQEFLALSDDPSWIDIDPPGQFSGLVAPLAAPEPASLLLAAIGLLLVLAGPVARRLRLRRQAAISSKTRTMSR